MNKLASVVLSGAFSLAFFAGACKSDDSPGPANSADAGASDASNANDTSTSQKGEGGEDDASPGSAVNGVVTSYKPVAGATVVINGVGKTTDANGSFQFADVPSTYTMSVIAQSADSSGFIVVEYVNLTTRTPTVALPFDLIGSINGSTTITGSATGVGLPIADPYILQSALFPKSKTILYGGGSAATADNLFPTAVTSISALGTTTISADLYAFVISSTDRSVLSFGFDPGFTFAPTDTTATAPAINLAAVGPTNAVSGTYTVPSGSTFGAGVGGCYVTPSIYEGAILVGTASGGTFGCEVPTALNWKTYAYIGSSDATANTSARYVPVTGASSTVVVTLDAPAILTAPTMGDDSVDPAAPFKWTTPTTSQPPVYVLDVTIDENVYLVFLNGASSTVLPDLSAFGVTFASHGDGDALLSDYQGLTMDNLVDGTTDLSPLFTGTTADLSFTTK